MIKPGPQVPRAEIDFIGYSMRTARYRYTEWLHFDGAILHGDFRCTFGLILHPSPTLQVHLRQHSLDHTLVLP